MPWALLPGVLARFPRRSRLALLLALPLTLILYYNFGVLSSITRSNVIDIKFDPPSTSIAAQPQGNSTPLPVGDVLLVSSFFPLNKTSHTDEEYSQWMSLFLGKISTTVYFYTTPELEPYIRAKRGNLPITINTTFISPFGIPPLVGREQKYEDMHARDRERRKHKSDLYAVRTAKPYMLAEALRAAQQAEERTYRYAFWVDPASFREDHAYAVWPDVSRLDEIWTEGRREGGARLEDMFFVPVWELPHTSMLLWKEDMGPIDTSFAEGSFYGGRPSSVFWFERYFYAYHNFYLDQLHAFVGNDQTVMNSLILLHPENFITVWHNDPQSPVAVYDPAKAFNGEKDMILGDCGNSRFYYQFFVASKNEQDANRKIWDAVWNFRFWKIERWMRRRESCRQTRVLPLEWLLRRPFGEMWRAPDSTVPF